MKDMDQKKQKRRRAAWSEFIVIETAFFGELLRRAMKFEGRVVENRTASSRKSQYSRKVRITKSHDRGLPVRPSMDRP